MNSNSPGDIPVLQPDGISLGDVEGEFSDLFTEAMFDENDIQALHVNLCPETPLANTAGTI